MLVFRVAVHKKGNASRGIKISNRIDTVKHDAFYRRPGHAQKAGYCVEIHKDLPWKKKKNQSGNGKKQHSDEAQRFVKFLFISPCFLI